MNQPLKLTLIKKGRTRKRVSKSGTIGGVKLSKLKSSKSQALPKNFRTFYDGMETSNYVLTRYNSQPNRIPVYIRGKRIHHGFLGALAFGVGLFFDSKPMMGFGTGLMLDDLHDAPDWFHFNK